MNILFLLLQMPAENKGGGMYVDLAEELRSQGHNVTIMAPDNAHKASYCQMERGMKVVRVGSKATQGVSNMIKKGIALATLPYFYRKAYNRFLKEDSFDWILMPTPPITLVDFVAEVKQRTGAKFYLILRDIHPQSVASLGILKRKWMYNYLNRRAKKGYALADVIGCMSQGNIDFIAQNNPEVDSSKLVLLYNWLKREPSSDISKQAIREQYALQDKFIALFGGNIGLGQRIENIVALAEHYRSCGKVQFVVIGKGVEKERLARIAQENNLTNILFLDFMPQAEYLAFVQSVDLGLVSISEKYAVPTCPSKAVSYMSLGIPIFAMINDNNDYGPIIEKAGAGYWVVGSDKERTFELFDKIIGDASLRGTMSECGVRFYEENCTVEVACKTMLKQMQNE